MNYPTNTRLQPANITFTRKTLGTSFTSPFTGQTQTVRFGGQLWQLDFTYATLFQSDGEELMGFLGSCNGIHGTFYYTLPSKFHMSGSLSVTIASDGNTFTGGTGQVGKFGYASGRLVQFTGTGSLFPRLPAGAATINTSTGVLLRLASNDSPNDVNFQGLYEGVVVGTIEAL